MPRRRAIHRYIEQVQRWMEQPRTRRRLKTQTVRYNQLWSSLDTLRQTEMAVESYARHDGEAGTGTQYLALYGLLQALVLQQDAVCHLQEALGEQNSGMVTNRSLQEIRTIRNWSVGHPTKVDRREALSHHKIKRAKLGRGFELISAFDDGRRQFTFISIADLIRRQGLVVGRILRKLARGLNEVNLSKPVEIARRNEHIYRPGKKDAKQQEKTVVGRRQDEIAMLLERRRAHKPPPPNPPRKAPAAEVAKSVLPAFAPAELTRRGDHREGLATPQQSPPKTRRSASTRLVRRAA